MHSNTIKEPTLPTKISQRSLWMHWIKVVFTGSGWLVRKFWVKAKISPLTWIHLDAKTSDQKSTIPYLLQEMSEDYDRQGNRRLLQLAESTGYIQRTKEKYFIYVFMTFVFLHIIVWIRGYCKEFRIDLKIEKCRQKLFVNIDRSFFVLFLNDLATFR